MNILVINPPNKPFSNKSILAEPLDVLMIATIIKEKFLNVHLLDMDVKRMNNNINDYLSDDNIIVFVYDYQIPLHTTEAKENIFEIIKNVNKKCKFIIIGKTSTFNYKEFIDNGIDVVIKGVAEDKIIDCIYNIYNIKKLKDIPNLVIREEDKITFTKEEKTDLSFQSLPIPDRSLINHQDYIDTHTIITSRGCINKCNFCTTPYFFSSYSMKSVDDMVLEIENLVNKYKAKKILILDDNFPVDKKRVRIFCKKIKEKNIKCLFGCLCSLNCYEYNLMKEMYDVGFRWIHFGVESTSKKILKKMNKNINICDVEKIISEVKSIGYRVRVSIILDYPGTNASDLKLTTDLLKSIEPHEIRLHYLAYRLGTPIYNDKISNKTQYIHSNKPNNKNEKIEKEIKNIINVLKERKYVFIDKEVDFNKFNNLDKNFKIATFTPIKYGMCWYE